MTACDQVVGVATRTSEVFCDSGSLGSCPPQKLVGTAVSTQEQRRRIRVPEDNENSVPGRHPILFRVLIPPVRMPLSRLAHNTSVAFCSRDDSVLPERKVAGGYEVLRHILAVPSRLSIPFLFAG
jgi:hypothetical protein